MDEKETVTYCGLCCLDCHGYQGRIPDLARDLRKELRKAHYEKFAGALSKLPFASGFSNYSRCYELLGLMMKFRCKAGCRSGGGPPFCQIRKCCGDKRIEGCWECEDSPACGKLDSLCEVHGDAHRKNIEIIKKSGIRGFLGSKRNW